MNQIPKKIKDKWSTEETPRICLRANEGNCAGRLTKEHAIYYKGKQLQEDWAILDICEFHHSVCNFQDKGNLNKEIHVWIALNRAPEARLRELSKAEDKLSLKGYLNSKYGVYVAPTPLPDINY